MKCSSCFYYEGLWKVLSIYGELEFNARLLGVLPKCIYGGVLRLINAFVIFLDVEFFLFDIILSLKSLYVIFLLLPDVYNLLLLFWCECPDLRSQTCCFKSFSLSVWLNRLFWLVIGLCYPRDPLSL